MTDWWQPSRERALTELDRERTRAFEDFARPRMAESTREACDRLVGTLRKIDAKRERVLSPGWLPDRPERKMPSLWLLAWFWAQREPFAGYDIAVPACFACGWQPPCPEDDAPKRRWNKASGCLERAHLIDRFLGGLDGPQNIVPLCCGCHRVMPMFDIDQKDAAIAWVLAGGLFQAIRAEMTGVNPGS